MKPPRITIVFLLGNLGFGGTERQFIETLKRLDRQNFDIRVLSLPCAGMLRAQIEALGVPFACVDISLARGRFHPASIWNLARLILALTRFLKQVRPDILQSYLFWTNIYGSIAAKLAGVPVVVTGRRETLEPKYRRFPNRWLQGLSNRLATLAVANSETVKAECVQWERHLNSAQIQVIYNGIALQEYQPAGNTAAQKRAWGIAEAAPVVGVVARLHPRKGHVMFLKAAALVAQEFPAARFLLIGRDQGMQQSLETLARQLGIREAVVFTGEQCDVAGMIAMLDVLVSASVIEGLSNAILEGMAMSKPVVATKIAGNPELVVHEETGLLVPPHDHEQLALAILRLLRTPKLRMRFGEAGRRRVEELFQVEDMIRRTEALYRSLVAEHKKVLDKNRKIR